MKILLHDNSLNLRGTSVAIFDYAFYLEKLYDIKCAVSYFKNHIENNDLVVKKFKNHFELLPLESPKDIDTSIANCNADIFYAIKAGSIDDVVAHPNSKTVIHAVFPSSMEDYHGDVYAYVSEWLSLRCSNGSLPYVPHMVNLPNVDVSENYRQKLGIPDDAIVFGRYGGVETFDIPFVFQAIQKSLDENPNYYFLFCNTNKFINHPRAIFVNSVVSLKQKAVFINTCDAMIHARQRGETFGLSILEFMSKQKPIFTYGGSMEQNHYLLLDDQGIYYNNADELYELLRTFVPHTKSYPAIEQFTPENVTKQFHDVFVA